MAQDRGVKIEYAGQQQQQGGSGAHGSSDCSPVTMRNKKPIDVNAESDVEEPQDDAVLLGGSLCFTATACTL